MHTTTSCQRKFTSQTSDSMGRGKNRGGKSQIGEEKEVRRAENRKREKKEDAGARKGRKAAIRRVFPVVCGSGGSKSRLAKAAGAEPSGRMRDEQLPTAAAQSTFPRHKSLKNDGSGHFWKLGCRKSARCCGAKNIFPSQSFSKLTRSGHFWKLRCRESAQRCGTFPSQVAPSTFPSQNVQSASACTFGS